MSALEPRTLEVTTNVGCPVRCAYCPQDVLLRAYAGPKLLDLELFKAVLGELPSGTGVHFSGMSEPFLNPSCPEMVLAARDLGFPVTVYTTLVGLVPADLRSLLVVPYREFLVHLPSVSGGERIPVTGSYLEVLSRLARHPSAVFLRFGDLPEAVAGVVPPRRTRLIQVKARAGNLLRVAPLFGPIRCSRSVHRNVLLPDGRVLLCCQDYGMRHVLGELPGQGYAAVAGSVDQVLEAMRGGPADLLCRTCELAVPVRKEVKT